MCHCPASCEAGNGKKPERAKDQIIRDRERIMDGFTAVFNFIFGCHHRHLSRVFTISGRTYRMCCDCGTKFNYSLENMRMERRFRVSDAPTCAEVLEARVASQLS
jgi:hypothetical protein